jgi:iron complex outermembrane receptor protein
MPMMYRQNLTHGSGAQFSVAGTMQIGSGELRVGIDGIAADHDSVISNPNMAMFRVDNFVDVERDVAGIYAEWTREYEASDMQLGLRYKQVNTNAGRVGAMGMPEPMATSVGQLADAFNAANRDLSWNSVDFVFKYRRALSNTTEWIVEAGSKTRAPSYQELYLWLPLQAAGGLADGRTYIGDLTLDDERSNEIVLGLAAAAGRVSFAPQVYYRKVDNYIQGSPADDMLANMVSTMMSGSPALQFSNVDAEIWGLDVAWKFDLADRWYLDGIASLTRGRRTDVSDNLYRLAPANGSIGLTYSAANWSIKPELVLYAGQDKVSAYNDEQSTPGYGLVNVGLNWQSSERLRLEARIDNLLDRQYQDHLTGINRAPGSDIPVGTRIYGAERTLSAGVMLNF